MLDCFIHSSCSITFLTRTCHYTLICLLTRIMYKLYILNIRSMVQYHKTSMHTKKGQFDYCQQNCMGHCRVIQQLYQCIIVHFKCSTCIQFILIGLKCLNKTFCNMFFCLYELFKLNVVILLKAIICKTKCCQQLFKDRNLFSFVCCLINCSSNRVNVSTCQHINTSSAHCIDE